jgi:hypothetical protein
MVRIPGGLSCASAQTFRQCSGCGTSRVDFRWCNKCKAILCTEPPHGCIISKRVPELFLCPGCWSKTSKEQIPVRYTLHFASSHSNVVQYVTDPRHSLYRLKEGMFIPPCLCLGFSGITPSATDLTRQGEETLLIGYTPRPAIVSTFFREFSSDELVFAVYFQANFCVKRDPPPLRSETEIARLPTRFQVHLLQFCIDRTHPFPS